MTNTTDIKQAIAADIPKLNAIVAQCGLFEPDEIRFMDQMIADHFDQDEPAGKWLLSQHTAAYLALEEMSDGAWNVLFIATLPEARGQGHGARMMAEIEEQLRASGARLLIVETSGTERFARTRGFYQGLAYRHCGQIEGYFGPEDDKVIFAKTL